MPLWNMLLSLPLLLVVVGGILPSSWANRQVRFVRRFVTTCAAGQLALAVATSLGLIAGVLQPSTAEAGLSSVASISVYYDGVAALMFTLVSFVGFVVCRFSMRYLDGESTQGRYFRWIGFTLGSVSLMVVAGNLLLFMAAWTMTSLGLHQLLLHYPDRRDTRRAAWMKFGISRFGDFLLVAGVIATHAALGTLDFQQIFQMMQEPTGMAPATQQTLAVAAWLIMLGALVKTAQFPFHIWLPNTLGTPTPVSALMHAGIVNAGGYLMIRISPLLVAFPDVLGTAAVIGTITACYGAIVMQTQTSIKRSLAYSTVAQMGFMVLQCGIGAFTAAMLHIVAHSLYKAYAFLGSGNVLKDVPQAGRPFTPLGWRAHTALLMLSAAVAVGSYTASSYLVGLGPFSKPGGMLLSFLLCLALTTWCYSAMRTGNRLVVYIGVAGTAALSLTYMVLYVAIDRVVASGSMLRPLDMSWPVFAFVVFAFSGLFGLHLLLGGHHRARWLAPLQVHAANGFYLDAAARRVVDPLLRV